MAGKRASAKAVPQSDLLRRNRALQGTLARYRNQPFAWGKVDCVRMARTHLVAMGHAKVPKLPKYRSAKTAIAALKATGHATLPALLDSLLPRINPAEALPGDFVILKGDAGLHALTISVGQKVAGWYEGQPALVMMTPLETEGAWRA